MLEAFLFAILAIVVGLGLGLMGYVAFRVLLPIVGFLGGLWIGLDATTHFLSSFPIVGVSLGLVLGLILGVIFAAIAYLVYELAIVIFGISIGYALGAGFMLLLGLPNGILTFVVGVVVAIALGMAFISVNMPKLYIMGLTAFAGASALVAGALVLFGQISPSEMGLGFVDAYIGQNWFLIAVWALFGAIGFFIQYQMIAMAEALVPASYSYEVTKKEYSKKKKRS
jgi:hypothetical protein